MYIVAYQYGKTHCKGNNGHENCIYWPVKKTSLELAELELLRAANRTKHLIPIMDEDCSKEYKVKWKDLYMIYDKEKNYIVWTSGNEKLPLSKDIDVVIIPENKFKKYNLKPDKLHQNLGAYKE